MKFNEMGDVLSGLRLMLPKYAPQEISKKLCVMWISALSEFSDEQILKAFAHAAQNLTEFPTAATIKRICLGSSQNDEEIGSEIAARITGAITRFGYASPERAKEAIGELGWKVVQMSGGWVEVCATEYDQMPSAKKIWRDLATGISKKLYINGKEIPPQLPDRKETPKALQEALKLACGGIRSGDA